MTEKNTVTEAATDTRNFRKTREGLVVSDKMDKTVVVAVGDRVLLMETRPLSASKRWRVVEVLEKAK